jgi:hypothetical protein
MIVMLYHRHIETTGMAHRFSERAHRPPVMIRSRTPRDVRSRFIMPGLSGESMAKSFPRERDGVGERDLRSGWVDHYPSGESGSASFPREPDGVREREVRSASFTARPIRKSRSTCTDRSERNLGRPNMPSKNIHAQQVASCNPLPAVVLPMFFRDLNIQPEFVLRRRW